MKKFGVALFCLAALALAATAQAQINFAIPADAPDGGVGYVGVLEVSGNGNMDTQDNARASLSSNTGTRNVLNTLGPTNTTINMGDSHGNFQPDNPFPVNGEQIAVIFRGTIAIPTTGVYSFDVNSDDGFTLAFDGGTSPFNGSGNFNGAALQTYNGNANGAFQFSNGRGFADSVAQISLTAGNHPFVMTYHQGGGGYNVELSAAAGAFNNFDPSAFNLVGGQAVTGHSGQNALPAVDTWNYVEVHGPGGYSLPSVVSDVQAVWGGGSASGGVTVTQANPSTINFTDPEGQNTGGHPAVDFPGNTAADDNDFGAGAKTTLHVTSTNDYTFDMWTDDNSRFVILDAAHNPVLPTSISGNASQYGGGDTVPGAFGTDGCCSDYLGHYHLTPGDYTIEAFFHEGGGGSGFFLYGTTGYATNFDASRFQLIGAGINGDPWAEPGLAAGLALVPEPSSFLLAVFAAAGLGLAYRRRRAA